MEAIIAVVMIAIIVGAVVLQKKKKAGPAPVRPPLTDEEVQALTDAAENRDRIK